MVKTKVVKRSATGESGSGIAELNNSQRIPKTLVFVSHDSRDADLAEAFTNLLSDVSAGMLKSFRSSDKKGTSGIEFGTEWYSAIMTHLSDATDVVALLTQKSVDRPWILYEAGVAKGKLDTNVLGIALGVPLEKVSSGPFGQFQNCADDEDSLTKLVLQLLSRNPDAAPREEAVRVQVRVFIQNFQSILKKRGVIPANTHQQADENNIAKLFEETKIMVRDLPLRVEEHVRHFSRRPSMKIGRKFHPMMIEELFHHSALGEDRDGAASSWLIFISLFRDDLPWVFEFGMEIYRSIMAHDDTRLVRSRNQFMRMIDATTRGPMSHELFDRRDDEIHFVIRFIPEFLDRLMTKIIKDKSDYLLRKRVKFRPITKEQDASNKS